MNDGHADPELALADVAWVLNMARSLVRDSLSAEDLAQETWLVALRSSRRGPRAWLGGVARILARRRLRRVEPRPVGLMEDSPTHAATADELLAQADFQRRVLGAVTALDEPYRTTVLLRHFEGLAVEELSRRMGVPSSTGRTRLQRAHTQLRERLDREYGERGSWSVLAGAAPPASLAWTGAGTWTGAGIMGTQVKIVVVCAAAVGVGVWTWRELREPPRRAKAEGVRTAELVPVAAPPQESAQIDAGAVAQRDLVPVAGSAATDLESVQVVATVHPTSAASPSVVVPSTPLERRFDAVADTFLTEEPDLLGLLSLTGAFADAATFEIDEATGRATGKLLVAGSLKGTFSIHEQEYRVELDTENRSGPFRRTLTLKFTDESRSAHDAEIRVQSYPNKSAIKDIDHEFIGWRASLDPVEGAKAYRTTMKVQDPSSGPFVSDSYLYETSDTRGFEPRNLPGLANTDAFDRWLEHLRPLRER